MKHISADVIIQFLTKCMKRICILRFKNDLNHQLLVANHPEPGRPDTDVCSTDGTSLHHEMM